MDRKLGLHEIGHVSQVQFSKSIPNVVVHFICKT